MQRVPLFLSRISTLLIVVLYGYKKTGWMIENVSTDESRDVVI